MLGGPQSDESPMPLISLWSSNAAAIEQFTIEQVVAAAGDGNLKDVSECAQELRDYLSKVPSSKLAEYVDRCLTFHFPKSGMVLQDLVNELGRRLDYKVTNGRYQGVVNAIGFDGIWTSPEGHTIVLEVKTTDAYRISLDNIARYREKLIASGQIVLPCSLLIVVGREDTGELEAQVRGSRHAWDMRLISADALIKLVQLKENADGPETGQKIRSLLAPMEYTRLDAMIDVMFTTAKDVETAVGTESGTGDETSESVPSVEKVKDTWQFTDSALLQTKREAIIAVLAQREGTSLIKKSRALYWNPSHEVRAAFTISKRYLKGVPYWYAYHPQWDAWLGESDRSFVVLGCMDLDSAYAIPLDVMRSVLFALHTTEKEDGAKYWHLYVRETGPGQVSLVLPKSKKVMPLSEYAITVPH
jgi:hypothetical protein